MKFTEGLLCSVLVSSAKLRHNRKEESIPINGRGIGELRTDSLPNKTLILVSRVEDMVEVAVWDSHKSF